MDHVELVLHGDNGNTRTQLKVPKSVIIVFEKSHSPFHLCQLMTQIEKGAKTLSHLIQGFGKESRLEKVSNV